MVSKASRHRAFWSRASMSLVLAALLSMSAHAAEPARPAATQASNTAPTAPANTAAYPRTNATNANRQTDAIAAEEAKSRELRAASIAIQQRLRAQQRAREEAQRDQSRNERCVGGQRMRRVANGWVGVGNC